MASLYLTDETVTVEQLQRKDVLQSVDTKPDLPGLTE
jgi:hypothetical protein